MDFSGILHRLFWMVLIPASVAAQDTLADAIRARSISSTDDSLSLFLQALQVSSLLDTVLDNPATPQYTVLAPTNSAIQQSPQLQLYLNNGLEEEPHALWHGHLVAALQHHIFAADDQGGGALQFQDIFERSELNSLHGDPVFIDRLRARSWKPRRPSRSLSGM